MAEPNNQVAAGTGTVVKAAPWKVLALPGMNLKLLGPPSKLIKAGTLKLYKYTLSGLPLLN